MKYRPDDWKGIDTPFYVLQSPQGNYISKGDANSLYEAGADAMLEALKKKGTYGHLFDDSILTPEGSVVGLEGYDDANPRQKDGTFVFIPDEEVLNA